MDIDDATRMSQDAIPPDLRRFILAKLPSVPHLEALLLLRERPEGLGYDMLAARLYVTTATAARLSAELEQASLVHVEATGAGARYAPQSDDVRDTVDRLAAVYARNVVAVSHLIHSTIDRKASQFANAFRMRKERE
jgi:hypothetical protein